MAQFAITLYEIAAHTFMVDALNVEGAVELARGRFDAQLDADTCVSLGLDRRRAPTIVPLPCDLANDPNETFAVN